MILTALSDSGGVKYLVSQAKDNPVAFVALLGKIVPREVSANVNLDADLGLSQRLQSARANQPLAPLVRQIVRQSATLAIILVGQGGNDPFGLGCKKSKRSERIKPPELTLCNHSEINKKTIKAIKILRCRVFNG